MTTSMLSLSRVLVLPSKLLCHISTSKLILFSSREMKSLLFSISALNSDKLELHLNLKSAKTKSELWQLETLCATGLTTSLTLPVLSSVSIQRSLVISCKKLRVSLKSSNANRKSLRILSGSKMNATHSELDSTHIHISGLKMSKYPSINSLMTMSLKLKKAKEKMKKEITMKDPILCWRDAELLSLILICLMRKSLI